ncbi:hypothetical protein DFP72DRAFT_1062051 [Ephemerocybe angulata]|uniref:BRCT domain-containing protein n=1 Tax=Ephemerocybe angulata TaxID=980116 RepID=A0A8H6ICA0_9AGAR|nr:hypothetical protein DFP72DRAFT_1062051 [Tulosesus angulatus]
MLFYGLAFFTKAVPMKMKALWKRNGGKIVQTPSEFFEARFMFCAGGCDPELSELLSRRIIVRHMAWIEACVIHDFCMPIASYTLDENDMVMSESDRSFESCSAGSGSTSMTCVEGPSGQDLRPILPVIHKKNHVEEAKERREQQRKQPLVVYAHKGILRRRLSTKRRTLSRTSSLKALRVAASLSKKTQKQRVSQPSSSEKPIHKDRVGVQKGRVVVVVPANHYPKKSDSATTTVQDARRGVGDVKDIHVDVDLPRLHPKSQIPPADQIQSPPQVLAATTATTTERRGGNENENAGDSPLRAFFDSIPEVLRRSLAFQKMLALAVDTAVKRKAASR